MLPLAIGVLQALPGLLQTGFDIYNVVKHTNDKVAVPTNEVESFALNILKQLPGLLNAGIDVTAMVQHGAESVGKMVKENRGPTTAEWDEQHARLAALDSTYDKAAMQRGPGS